MTTIRVNISVRRDTLERLDQYAFENHSSRSQAITDLVWNAKVKNCQLRGQISLDEIMIQQNSSQKRTKSR